MGASILIAVLLAGPSPSILLVPSAPTSRSVCEELVEGFSAERVRVKLAGEKSEAVTCMTRKGTDRAGCLADAVTRAKADGLVVVTAGTRAQTTTLALQLLSRAGEALHRPETVRGPRPRISALARPAIARTMSAFRSQLAEEKPEAPTPPVASPAPPPPIRHPAADAPVATRPMAPPTPPRVVEIEINQPPMTPPPRPSPVPAWIAAGVAVAALGVAGTFTGLGLADQSRLNTVSHGVSPLSYREATALKDRTNLELSIALGASVGVVVGGVTAGVLWPK